MVKPSKPQTDDNRSEAESTGKTTANDWWNYCPNCGQHLENVRCKYRCPNCHYFMSCSDFD
jgi:acetyl-CoA carboxylase beta subunit